MVVFSPPNPKYTVTVFTDVDCVYCRALHRQIADYNRLGVRVRYVFFPRTGPNTASWFKAEQVWCSADRKDALTRAKLGEPLAAKVCADNPVAREYALGQAIGLEGTPGHRRLQRRHAGRLSAARMRWSRRCRAARHVAIVGARLTGGRSSAALAAQRSSSLSLSGLPSHSLASAGAGPSRVITGHCLASSALSCLNCS